MVEENIPAMTDLARAHGVKAILCSVMPISDYTARKQSGQRPPADILKLNAWLREFAAKVHAEYQALRSPRRPSFRPAG